MNLSKQLRLFIEYFFVCFLFILVAFLPINFVSILGGYLFKLIGPFSKSHKIAISNYKKIFNGLHDQDININIKKSWENLGKTLLELSILSRLIDKKNNKISVKGLENLNFIRKNNEQVIFFSIHQSNWEICVPVINQLGIKIGAIYRHLNNKYVNELILKKRNKSIESSKSFYTPKGMESAKQIISAIKNNFSMFVLIDQKDSAGEKTKLFNIDVKTQTGFLKIAKNYNLKLIPVKNIRHNINDFTIKFYPPINPFEKNISEVEAMNSIHKIIERWIIDNPSQWFWQHNRFN